MSTSMALRRPAQTPQKSPARKKARVSSEFDDFPTPSQEELRGFDEIEARFSQEANESRSREHSGLSAGTSNTSNCDSDNPFLVPSDTFKPPRQSMGFSKASSISLLTAEPDFSSSQDAPPEEQDYSAWFAPAGVQSVGFKSAKDIVAPTLPEPIPIFSGFQKASSGTLAPSAAALKKAKEKMMDIWTGDEELAEPVSLQPQPPASISTASASFTPAASFARPVLRAMDNTPASPSPARPAEFASPLAGKSQMGFKPPFAVPSSLATPIRANPVPYKPASSIFANARPIHPLASTPINASSAKQQPPSGSSLGFSTPGRPNTLRKHTPARFSTPFKAGMKPGEPGRKALEASQIASTSSSGQKPAPKASVFEIKTHQRPTLETCGLKPRNLTHNEETDINGLDQITPQTALYYSFYDSLSLDDSQSGHSTNPTAIGPYEALTHLHNRGCTLATKAWVENHWCLILWKLAGMTKLHSEGDRSQAKRWCWKEVLAQLLYRYEREINRGVRPPLRKLAAHDVPASCPMVLCVSNITWDERENGTIAPELELTDGWYRLRAQVDEPLAKAIRRGIIRVGRKMSVAGCSLSAERKEPGEILEVYDSVKLVVRGNASHLAPWHAKLGFQKTCPIATMHSLTPDGGIVPSMDLVVMKVYPKFFIEFTEKEGRRTAGASRTEKEETREREKWMRRREMELAKLQDEFEKNHNRYQIYADRLERKAGPNFRQSEDGPPDHIYGMYDELEYPDDANALFSRISSKDAGWLAMHVRKTLEQACDGNREGVERDLQAVLPPRVVVSARILIVKDSQTARRGSNRTAELTVWDVNKLYLTDGRPEGYFDVGQRFKVTSVHPTNASSWMGHEEGAQIFLCTKGSTSWQRIKS